MQITDTEFMLVRQRNQILSDAEAMLDARDRQIIELRKALAIVKNQLVAERTERLSLQIRLQRLSQRH